MVTITAKPSSTQSSSVSPRASSRWASYLRMDGDSPRVRTGRDSGEDDSRRSGEFLTLGELDVLEISFETDQGRHDAVRKRDARGVEAGDPVVVGLPGECDPVLGARQLLGQL